MVTKEEILNERESLRKLILYENGRGYHRCYVEGAPLTKENYSWLISCGFYVCNNYPLYTTAFDDPRYVKYTTRVDWERSRNINWAMFENKEVKVIFLDIDGVLNSAQDRFSYTIETDKHLQLLKQLVNKTNAKIVLSSSWRLVDSCLFQVIKRLEDFNMKLFDVIWKRMSGPRGEEIREWLSRHDVESFVILDDEADMCEFKETNLVQTDPMVGLVKKDVDKAIGILNKGDF